MGEEGFLYYLSIAERLYCNNLYINLFVVFVIYTSLVTLCYDYGHIELFTIDRTLAYRFLYLDIIYFIIFLLDLIFRILSNRRVMRLKTYLDVISALSVISLSSVFNKELLVLLGYLRFPSTLRIIKIFQLLNVHRLTQRVLTLILSVISFILVCSGIVMAFQYFSNYTGYSEIYSFVDCILFVVVTISTVGYGNMHPLTNEASGFTIAMIIVSFSLIPYVISEVSSMIFELHSSYQRPTEIYKGTAYILICGDIDYQTASNVLNMLFSTAEGGLHPIHSCCTKDYSELGIVILSPRRDNGIHALIENPVFEERIIYIKGSPTNEMLKKLRLESFKACLLLNYHSEDSLLLW